MIADIWSAVFGDPLHGDGYQFWSGIGSDFGELTILAAVLAALRHRQCHVTRCWRLGHLDPAVHAPACHKHHSFRGKRGRVPLQS